MYVNVRREGVRNQAGNHDGVQRKPDQSVRRSISSPFETWWISLQIVSVCRCTYFIWKRAEPFFSFFFLFHSALKKRKSVLRRRRSWRRRRRNVTTTTAICRGRIVTCFCRPHTLPKLSYLAYIIRIRVRMEKRKNKK